MAQPFCVVDVLVSRQSPEHGLPQHADQSMPRVLSGAGIGDPFASYRAEAERIVEFPVSEQTRIGSHDQTAKLQRQPAVEIEPEGFAFRFTRWVRHAVSFRISLTC